MSSTKAQAIQRSHANLQERAIPYAYRHFGKGSGITVLFLQHFTASSTTGIRPFTDPLRVRTGGHHIDNGWLGRSTGEVPGQCAKMAGHDMAVVS